MATDEQTDDNLLGVLKGWQIGLIIGLVSLAIVVLLIFGVVGMGYLTVKNRKKIRASAPKVVEDNSRPFPPQFDQKPFLPQLHQKSMLEEIQLVGEAGDTDTVDYGGMKELEIYQAILYNENIIV